MTKRIDIPSDPVTLVEGKADTKVGITLNKPSTSNGTPSISLYFQRPPGVEGLVTGQGSRTDLIALVTMEQENICVSFFDASEFEAASLRDRRPEDTGNLVSRQMYTSAERYRFRFTNPGVARFIAASGAYPGPNSKETTPVLDATWLSPALAISQAETIKYQDCIKQLLAKSLLVDLDLTFALVAQLVIRIPSKSRSANSRVAANDKPASIDLSSRSNLIELNRMAAPKSANSCDDFNEWSPRKKAAFEELDAALKLTNEFLAKATTGGQAFDLTIHGNPQQIHAEVKIEETLKLGVWHDGVAK